MIRHIVMFKLKPEGSGEVPDRIKQEIRERLEGLPGKIDVIRSMEVGINVLRSERAFDLVLFSTFDSFNDLEKYRVHPEHIKVVEFIGRYREKTAAVDYYC
jgi:hypothetical protein